MPWAHRAESRIPEEPMVLTHDGNSGGNPARALNLTTVFPSGTSPAGGSLSSAGAATSGSKATRRSAGPGSSGEGGPSSGEGSSGGAAAGWGAGPAGPLRSTTGAQVGPDPVQPRAGEAFQGKG